MKDLLEILIKGLVDDTDSVSITEKNSEKSTIYQVKVNKADMGRIIGKQGTMARSIRTVMKSIATKEHKKVNIEFVD